ncbi:unnamed protein product [Thelazia callipaeda]|uniref:Peptidyl-prolyl cis-trans isomerase CWC27 like protein n=1 Tax=Thelazia callipaeda TaxID=103827 RepID=A0A0N5CYE6_THECL|nr:unnamed protein product [Thelazia callipaeda]
MIMEAVGEDIEDDQDLILHDLQGVIVMIAIETETLKGIVKKTVIENHGLDDTVREVPLLMKTPYFLMDKLKFEIFYRMDLGMCFESLMNFFFGSRNSRKKDERDKEKRRSKKEDSGNRVKDEFVDEKDDDKREGSERRKDESERSDRDKDKGKDRKKRRHKSDDDSPDKREKKTKGKEETAP